jgi:N-acetylglucosaminyl-diphospho-decaprenol L-rhamnosyltransferase
VNTTVREDGYTTTSIMTRVSFVIVSYNSRLDLERCLGSLMAHPPLVDHDCVVVDNASSDGTPEYVLGHWPAVRLIETGANLGFGAANNLGIRQTSSELVLLLNPDTAVPPDAIDRLVHVVDVRPSVAVAGPRLVDADGRAELSFGPMIGPLAELRQKALVRGHARGVWPISAWIDRATRQERVVD